MWTGRSASERTTCRHVHDPGRLNAVLVWIRDVRSGARLHYFDFAGHVRHLQGVTDYMDRELRLSNRDVMAHTVSRQTVVVYAPPSYEPAESAGSRSTTVWRDGE